MDTTDKRYVAPKVTTLGTVSELTLFTLTKNGTVADQFSAALGVPGSDVLINGNRP